MTANTQLTMTLMKQEDTTRLGKLIGSRLQGGETLELSSDLGGGKTTFTKALVEGAGGTTRVSSPSFTINNQYPAHDLTIYHYDFYRLVDPGIMRYELLEVLRDPLAVVVIEWAALVGDVLPLQKLRIEFVPDEQDSRTLLIECSPQLAYLIQAAKEEHVL